MGDRDITTPIRPVPQMVQLPSSVVDEIANSGAGKDEITQLIRVLFRYRYLIAAVVATCSLVSFIYAFTATPQYTAETQIKIEPYHPVLAAADVEKVLLQSTRDSEYVDTQIQELMSYSLADRVLNDDQIRGQLFPKGASAGFFSRLFGRTPRDAQAPVPDESVYKHRIGLIKSYLNNIGVSPVRRTSIVTLAVTTPSRTLSARIANVHAEQYIGWVKDNRIKQQSEGLQFLRTQAEELKQKVAALERERAEYAEDHSIVALNKDQNITVQRMAQLDDLLTKATESRIEIEKIFSEAERAFSEGNSAFDDTATQQMRSRLAEFEGEYGNLSGKFTDSYPKMKQLKGQIDELKTSIENQRKQTLIGMKAKALAAEGKEQLLKEELEKQKSLAFELSRSEVQYNIISRELESSRDLLNSVLKQIKEMSVAVQSNASNIAIIDKAAIPETPSYPRKKLIVLIGVALGSIFALGLALVLQYFDNTIRSPDEIQNILNLPSLGVIPSFDISRDLGGLPKQIVSIDQGENKSNIEGGVQVQSFETIAEPTEGEDPNILPIVFVQNSRSPIAEAYRSVRTGLLLSQASSPPKVILVTSAQSAEGKTTSTANLAATLASNGARVLVIDADLRRPSMHKLFKLARDLPGLVELITGQCTLDQVLIPNLIKRISVLPAGTIPPNPSELLGTSEMLELINSLRAQYDHILIDSPPIMPVTDSIILSRFVDGVVVIVRGAHTSKKLVRDAVNRLRRVEANILGVVINDLDIKKADYYYYNTYYNSYYSSYGDDEGARRGVG